MITELSNNARTNRKQRGRNEHHQPQKIGLSGYFYGVYRPSSGATEQVNVVSPCA